VTVTRAGKGVGFVDHINQVLYLYQLVKGFYQEILLVDDDIDPDSADLVLMKIACRSYIAIA